jgi:hypothetical protein
LVILAAECRNGQWLDRSARSGVWERLFQTLAADADNAYAMIDSTIVRAHQHSAGARKKGDAKQSDAAAAD